MLSIIDELRQRMGQTRPDYKHFVTHTILDAILPGRHFRRGTLVELLGGGTTLAAIIAREALRDNGAIVVIDTARRLYPPAAAQIIDLDRLVVVQPREPVWFITQALSCPAVDAVLCWPCKVSSTMFRRWQLAAERGGSVGLLVRPLAARESPSWAEVRIVVETQSWGHWRIQVTDGQALEIGITEGRIHDRLHMASRPQLA